MTIDGNINLNKLGGISYLGFAGSGLLFNCLTFLLLGISWLTYKTKKLDTNPF